MVKQKKSYKTTCAKGDPNCRPITFMGRKKNRGKSYFKKHYHKTGWRLTYTRPGRHKGKKSKGCGASASCPYKNIPTSNPKSYKLKPSLPKHKKHKKHLEISTPNPKRSRGLRKVAPSNAPSPTIYQTSPKTKLPFLKRNRVKKLAPHSPYKTPPRPKSPKPVTMFTRTPPQSPFASPVASISPSPVTPPTYAKPHIPPPQEIEKPSTILTVPSTPAAVPQTPLVTKAPTPKAPSGMSKQNKNTGEQYIPKPSKTKSGRPRLPPKERSPGPYNKSGKPVNLDKPAYDRRPPPVFKGTQNIDWDRYDRQQEKVIARNAKGGISGYKHYALREDIEKWGKKK